MTEEQSERDEMGRFLTAENGNKGGPGRKKGSRNRLSEAFLSALDDDFAVHGVEVIRKVRAETPQVYLKIVSNLMPARLEAQLEANVNVHNEFDDFNIEGVLQRVAEEAGIEAALQLAGMFGISTESLTDGIKVLPSPMAPENPFPPEDRANWRDWNRRNYGNFDGPTNE